MARTEIAAALDGLPGLEGDVLRLMYVEDLPVAEVAALLASRPARSRAAPIAPAACCASL